MKSPDPKHFEEQNCAQLGAIRNTENRYNNVQLQHFGVKRKIGET